MCVDPTLHVLLSHCRLCAQLQSIMEDRLSELSALHWGLSGQLSKAEADLRDRQLPELEEQAGAVKAHVTVSQRPTPYCSCRVVATDCCSGLHMAGLSAQCLSAATQRGGTRSCHASEGEACRPVTHQTCRWAPDTLPRHAAHAGRRHQALPGEPETGEGCCRNCPCSAACAAALISATAVSSHCAVFPHV